MAKRDVKIDLGFLTVAEDSYENIQQQYPGRDVKPLLNSQCSYFMNQMGAGGVLLTAKHVEDIEKAAEVEISNPDDVVKATQKANKRSGDAYTVTAEIDPAYIAAAKQAAEWRGISLEALLTDCLNAVLGNSWLETWDAGPEGKVLRLDAKDWAKAKALTGKENPFGKDVIRAAEAATKGELAAA